VLTCLRLMCQTPPLSTNEWLEPHGKALTAVGAAMVVNHAWDVYTLLLQHAGNNSAPR